ncbi:MAG: hypothetical protein AVDCRST_MAG10-2933 [uncultured Acidimicrobiales bacterium]|uniref:Uncharacterized protein n=1 Tax=uncultured Acidimicrobiales bacterium TaxID=310071 RepID=A0A6J4IY88_9ACTN|nr:MAG: hypothetical protein AVDCRST_MAG10-2933 [uncultured Acidimicrobiales bacterium]
MASLELAEADVVAVPPERGHDAAAAALDGKHVIRDPVRDEHLWATLPAGRGRVARRERDDSPEQVAVGEAEPEGIGGPVGEALHGDLPRVDGVAAERVSESTIDEVHVRAVAAEDDVPRPASGLGGQEEQAGLVGTIMEGSQAVGGTPSGTVEHHHERKWAIHVVVGRHEDEPVATPAQSERLQTRLTAARFRPPRALPEPPSERTVVAGGRRGERGPVAEALSATPDDHQSGGPGAQQAAPGEATASTGLLAAIHARSTTRRPGSRRMS